MLLIHYFVQVVKFIKTPPRRRKWDLDTVSEIWNRPKYQYGNGLLTAISQRQHALNQWSNQGVAKVAKQAKEAERKVKTNNQSKVKVPYRDETVNYKRLRSTTSAIDNFVNRIKQEITTNPATMAIDDAVRNNTTRPIAKYLGLKSLGHRTYTEKDFPERKLRILDSVAKAIVGNRLLHVGDTLRYNFAGEDYDDTYLSGKRKSSFLDKLFKSNVSLGKTIGGGQMTIYNNGYDVTDVYDFDPNVRPKINGLYPLIRNVANYTNASEAEKDNTYKNKIRIHRDMYFGE